MSEAGARAPGEAGHDEVARLVALPDDQPRNYNYLPEELDLLIRAAGELWDSTGGQDPHDVLSALQREALDLAAVAYRAELDRYPPEKLNLLIRAAGELWDSTGGQDLHRCPCCRLALPTPGRTALDQAAAVFRYELNREMGHKAGSANSRRPDGGEAPSSPPRSCSS